jgi:hypothetical protein
MSRLRRYLVLSGMGGLLACLLLAGATTAMVTLGVLKPPLPHRMVAPLLTLVLGGFSLAEIPLMILIMRRLSAERADNLHVVGALNALYVFFAAVYGVPVSLLTGSVSWGHVLCALSIVRLVSSLAFIKDPAS